MTAWAVPGQSSKAEPSTVDQNWYVVTTGHFHVFSYGPLAPVYRVALELEQFREAYGELAGVSAVASPPILVMVFPDRESLRPFLPVYQGKPANLAGFFKRGSDENLIVLALQSQNPESGLGVIYHEYAHLLFRHNNQVWPLWLAEGMADLYSTFQASGHRVRIALPIEPYLEILKREPMMPMPELFGVGHDSPQYNESNRQGMFYAESWLLAHFLVAGDRPVYRSRFAQFTPLLRQGQTPEQAITNALGVPLTVLQIELQRYLQAGDFAPIDCVVGTDLSAPKPIAAQYLTPVQRYCRFGDELMRIDRLDTATEYFSKARMVAPASPLPWEGFGLTASAQGHGSEAIQDLAEAVRRGSTSFLAYYTLAREKYRSTSSTGDHFSRLADDQAVEIRNLLQKAIYLMPSFGPAHELLGFFEMVQGDDLKLSESELQLAVSLEPDNPSYFLPLAQVEVQRKSPELARRTLAPLLLPTAQAQLRADAESLLREMDRKPSGR